MIQLYAVNILPLQDEACFMDCYLRSAEGRRNKADTLKMQGDKARCIAAGLLLEYAYKKFKSDNKKELARANSFGYASEAGTDFLSEDEMPEIKSGKNGKPYFIFKDGAEPIFFNLSHSGNYVICAMADREVGADIQKVTRVRESLVRRCFSQEEKHRLDACGEDEMSREICFASGWAAKEAEAKLSGRGIGQLLENVKNNTELWQGILEEEYAWAVAWYLEPEGPSRQLILVDEGELFHE
ncbi:MAG: 4'-phosphopantetheinyl transferase superfamily protein [Lachnospiraceae bacterium]|nr:4'-phosphopantetheinyl transferase superfamily protein [Lachnospiraceae bacterium]